VVLAAVVAPVAAPSPSPLKEIIRVKSSALCSAIHDRIGPSVALLLQNDRSIRGGSQVLFDMGRDTGQSWMQIDKLYLENDVSKIVRNLDAIDDLLNPSAAGASDAVGKDDATIRGLKSDLQAVAGAQRDELNVLDGTLETEAMDELESPTSVSDAPPKHPLGAGEKYKKLGAQALDQIRSTQALERDFTRALLPIAAKCNVPVPLP
jgi:hypothetical protein